MESHTIRAGAVGLALLLSVAVNSSAAVQITAAYRDVSVTAGDTGYGKSYSMQGVWNAVMPDGGIFIIGTSATLNSNLDATGLSMSGQQQAALFGPNPPAMAEVNATESFLLDQPTYYQFSSTLSKHADSTLAYYQFTLKSGGQTVFQRGDASQFHFLSAPETVGASGQLSPGTYTFSAYIGSKVFGSGTSWVEEQTSFNLGPAVPEPSFCGVLLVSLSIARGRRSRNHSAALTII
jgi:hypothetical protein